MSWLVQGDVEDGRRELSFSLWGAGSNDVDDLAEVVADARLSAEEKAALIRELEALAGAEDRSGSNRGRG